MTPQKFALAIVFPGANIPEVVSAAMLHQVHIIDKESYDAGKDYMALSKKYQSFVEDAPIVLLFVFPDYSILADNERSLATALNKMVEAEG